MHFVLVPAYTSDAGEGLGQVRALAWGGTLARRGSGWRGRSGRLGAMLRTPRDEAGRALCPTCVDA